LKLIKTEYFHNAVKRNKAIGPDSIPEEILKLGMEAMNSYLAQLMDIMINNAAIPGDW
jgi:hypothetical protein